MSNKKEIFVVEMIRMGDRENFETYVLGVLTKKAAAIKNASKEVYDRGGKYEAEITGFIANSTQQTGYSRLIKLADAEKELNLE